MSLLRRLFERRKQPVEGKAQVSGFAWMRRTERAPFSFKTAKEKYEKCGMVAAAVDAVVERVVGPGYHTMCDEAPMNRAVVDRFAEEVNLDNLLSQMVFEYQLYGNCFVEKLFDGKRMVGLKIVPILTMESSIRRDKYGFVERYQQHVDGIVVATWEPDEVIHFRRNPTGASPYGVSVVQPINDALDILLDAETDMGKIIARYAAPKVAWMLENASKDTYDAVKSALKTVKPDEDYVVATLGETRVKADVIQIDPRARFEYFLNHLVNEIAAGLECPVTHLFRGDVRISDASATQMMEAFSQKIACTQRYFKRKIEAEVFRPLVEQEGHREVPRLNWGPVEEPEVRMEDLVKFVELGVIRVEEARKMLSRFGYELWKMEAAPEEG